MLVGSALILVTALLVLLMSLSRGLTETVIHSATTLMSGHVNVAGWYKPKATSGAPVLDDSAGVRKLVEENTPHLAYVIDRSRGWARIVSETSATQAGPAGIDVAEEGRLFETLALAEEREYREGGRAEVLGDPRKLVEPNTIMIFATHAKDLAVTVGDTVTLSIDTLSGARNTIDARVVAVAKDLGMMSSWNVYMNKESVAKLYQLDPKTTGAVMVYLDDVKRAPEVMEHLRKVLTDEGYAVMEHDPQPFWMKFDTVSGEDWVGQRLDLTTWEDEVSFMKWVLQAIDGLSAMLISILLVIIVIGIMNSMWISVRERTGEVGTLRAIGMSRRRVLVMFMFEAMLLGLASTSVGAALGAALATAIDLARLDVPDDAMRMLLMSDKIHLSVSADQLLMAVLLFTLVTVAASYLPALRASRLQPVTAIQTVT